MGPWQVVCHAPTQCMDVALRGRRSQKEDTSKMFSFPKRARPVTRIVVGLVALGAPFLGASLAQGSIGTGNQVTTNRPDIRTTTIIPTFNEVEYCFDGPIDIATAPPGSFGVG